MSIDGLCVRRQAEKTGRVGDVVCVEAGGDVGAAPGAGHVLSMHRVVSSQQAPRLTGPLHSQATGSRLRTDRGALMVDR